MLLKFNNGNAKLEKNIYTFSLPSGYTCPKALECLSKANMITGRIKDGKETKFRCFSASQEASYTSVRKQRWYNFELLKSTKNKAKLILDSLPSKASIIRIHVAGDFFSQDYFDAWLKVAEKFPEKKFYFYTKSLSFWIKRLDEIGNGRTAGKIANIYPNASRGGKDDDLIEEYGLKQAIVVYSEKQAESMGLEIDHDDSHALQHGQDFALLLHGVQPQGTEAAEALRILKQNRYKQGVGGYAPKRKALTLIEENN